MTAVLKRKKVWQHIGYDTKHSHCECQHTQCDKLTRHINTFYVALTAVNQGIRTGTTKKRPEYRSTTVLFFYFKVNNSSPRQDPPAQLKPEIHKMQSGPGLSVSVHITQSRGITPKDAHHDNQKQTSQPKANY